MKRYLVTGGAGFIGSHIVERLLGDGHSVVVLDNFSSGKQENLAFVKKYTLGKERYSLIKADIRDFSVCQQACKDIDYVFHQAALRSVPKSLEKPYDFNEVNINGTLNLLEASRQQKVKRFVFASSSSIYGTAESFPLKEKDFPLLISPYALTKLAGDYYCRIYSENYNLSTVCLRYFNVFGPRQAADDEYAVVIPKFICCFLNDEPPPVHGTGRQSRDFTYIENVVEANILAAHAADIKWAVLNIANGKEHTVLELVSALNKIMGKSITPVHTPVRPGDVFRTSADITAAAKHIGYKPIVDFQEGLKRTVDWFRNKNQG